MADTALAAPGPAPAARAGPQAPPGAPPPAAPPRQQILQATGVGLFLLAVVVLGFAGYLYGLSGVQEARSQAILYTRLQNELANQIGRAHV